ncbi:MAG: preprotein translocase subunit YajC [Peptoniphilaceae bacterium]|nr:preprotein translocase subunit YajC [Peptoniphilaceae bacterium]MDY5765946.1 preprotein translocase subunit YajC [Peptoniphilaceae bacterium]
MPQSGFTIILLVAMFAAMYFLTIRPQQKRAKEMQQQREALKVGDQIVTIGGVRGRITHIDDVAFEIETGSDHTRIEFLKNALSYVVTPDPSVADSNGEDDSELQTTEPNEESAEETSEDQ